MFTEFFQGAINRMKVVVENLRVMNSWTFLRLCKLRGHTWLQCSLG